MDFIFDTETSGLPPRGCTDPADPRMPHIIQLALAHRERSTGNIVNAATFLVKPEHDYWIDPKASAIHGITKTQIELQGIPASKALSIYRVFCSLATRRIAFNLKFDDLLIFALAYRSEIKFTSMPQIEDFCAMEAAKPLCKIPPTEKMVAAGFTDFKPPRLDEAYRLLVDSAGFDKAHDAFADVTATSKVLSAIERASV
jgi:DNA polymerase-3 subunit epsilon